MGDTIATAVTDPIPAGEGRLHDRLATLLEQRVREAMKPGERLPPHRDLARQFGVAIGTVTRAIDSLSERGIVRGEPGRGTFVLAAERPRRLDGPIDLSLNAPPPLLSPDALAAASERAARTVISLPNGGYVDLTGTPGQRRVMAGWLARTRLDCAADDLVLCVGAQQGLALAFADLARRSRQIATEGATFPGALAVAHQLGLEVLPIAHDEEGMVPDALERCFSETACRALYVTPICQNPLGFEMTAARRRDILRICKVHDAVIVEDDIYSIYGSRGAPTFKELAPDRVYYVTSLSKSVTALVRLGVLAPPAARRDAIAARLRAEIWGPAPLAVETGCNLIEMGQDVGLALQFRREARDRVHLASRRLDLVALPMPDGAPHLWLPMRLSEAERLARRAADIGIRLTPPDSMLVPGTELAGIRLCLMTVAMDDLDQALQSLAGLARAPLDMVI
ncbi:DNA-binding transcriptional MocR family regulator [Rhodoligotrophos appendicifer]|uniref:aminotransferase-like domain-containing protein n=1 Tax=Rhodoligotrophos appendicifer TaxID=987056 RepID=UPI00147845B8|nr:PLP-dependent aminotransferase family protein [Rhodoligotrophos appendicifer]